jgi:hypothetical protein
MEKPLDASGGIRGKGNRILMDSSGMSDAQATGPAGVPPRNPRSRRLHPTSFPGQPGVRRSCIRYNRRPIPIGAYHPNREPTRISAPAAGMRPALLRQAGPDRRNLEQAPVSARQVPEATRRLPASRPAPPRSNQGLRRPQGSRRGRATIPPQVMGNRPLI